MVATRTSHGPVSQWSLLDAVLASQPSRARILLEKDPWLAKVTGPSNFSCLHAAACTDSYKLVPALLAAGASRSAPLPPLSVDAPIAALDAGAAFALRQFLREHSKLPSSKLCAVFRGESLCCCPTFLSGGRTHKRGAFAVGCWFIRTAPRSRAVLQASRRCTSPRGWGTRRRWQRCCKPVLTASFRVSK